MYLRKQKGPKASKSGLSIDLISKKRGSIKVNVGNDHSHILVLKKRKEKKGKK